jgi:putative tryptophan/tyrosine transport system substrate-binding protein
MRRRDFIKVIAGSAAQLPLGVYAQQNPRKRRVGVLMIAASNFVDQMPAIDQITRRLKDLGWVDGQNLDLDIGWAGGNLDTARELAKRFIAERCDVIVAQGAITVKVLQRETKHHPNCILVGT